MRNCVYILLVLSFFITGCVEEIAIATDLQADIDITEVLIVEATLTDELKNQKVTLSRGQQFGNDSTAVFEVGATVQVDDDLGNTFNFISDAVGNYFSEVPFAAQTGRSYQLRISTPDGTNYQSELVSSAGVSIIDNIYAERVISDSGVDGMAIFVDSSNPDNNFNNYRYVYEETYKIIAPNWTSTEFEIIREEVEFTFDEVNQEFTEILYPDVRLVPRQQEERVCFNTVASNDIILSDGLVLNEGRTDGNLVRFINRNDPILSHRYSILVNQFVQSPDAAKFYNTLLQFSESESVFSAIQPGFIEGNIAAVNNPEALVIGYFEVASIASRRLFFNYEDFFPNEDLPPYFDGLNCERVFAPPLGNPERDGVFTMDDCGVPRPLIDYIKAEEIEFFLSSGQGLCEGPFFVTQRPCGDCTALGSNRIPEFWTE
ncbi:hypothetical protein MTsPCn5_04230 [Croceitalea sp. MTPC5]|uniref:DUF4249 domain-containing protein n=1 Tax=Croceitalea sp. MTPC5 TaxID=3056565 RepID=UPI002B396ACC|nr:hypothetical protein MTsPCn5_04230 [Croceitalea sp. MTPC5]